MREPSMPARPGLAPRSLRLVAAGVDLLVTLPLVLLWVIAAAGSLGLSLGLLPGALRERPWLTQAGTVFAGTVAWVVLAVASALLGLLTLYQWFLLATRGQTLGKRFVGIRIVDLEGRPAGFVRALVLRALVFSTLISLAISFTSALVPFAGLTFCALDYLPMFGEERRCLHDYFAGTQVRWVRIVEVYVGRVVAVAAGVTLAAAAVVGLLNREAVLTLLKRGPQVAMAPTSGPGPATPVVPSGPATTPSEPVATTRPGPAPTAAPELPSAPAPSPQPAPEKRLYQFTDDQGVVHVTDELASVPEKFRAQATSP